MTAMTARIIDGKAIAADLRGKIAGEVARLKSAHALTPGIAVVLVGENPASEVYVRNKSKAVAEAGMRAFDRKLPATTGEAELLTLIAELNADASVNGILVQLPLPGRSIRKKSSPRSIRPRTSTASIRSMSGGWRAGCRGWCRARRSAACCWRSPCIPRLPAWRRWWSAAPTSSASRSRSCCWRRTPPSPSAIPRRATWPACAGAPIC